MSASDVMRAWFQRVWCEGDESAIDELLAPDGEVFGLGPEAVIGPEGFKGFWNAIRSQFDDIHIEVVDAVDQDEMTYVRCEGDMRFGGRDVKFKGGAQCRVEAGLITRAWNYWDSVGFLADMGALPADAFPRACQGECFNPNDPTVASA